MKSFKNFNNVLEKNIFDEKIVDKLILIEVSTLLVGLSIFAKFIEHEHLFRVHFYENEFRSNSIIFSFYANLEGSFYRIKIYETDKLETFESFEHLLNRCYELISTYEVK